MAVHARLTTRTKQAYTPTIQAFSDYVVGSYYSTTTATPTTGDVWGTGLWGTAVWGDDGTFTARGDWEAVAATGTALAPAYQIGSDSAQAPSIEIISGDLAYESGNPF